MPEFNARVVESADFGIEEPENYVGMHAQSLHAPSGIAVGLLLGAGTWLVLGAIVALVRVSLM